MKRGLIILFLIIIFSTLTIQAVILDSDSDGIPDSQDKCPNTLPNSQVDIKGCSLIQFCGQFVCGLSCDLADWKDDEILIQNPHDCKTVIKHREGEPYPACIPVDDPKCFKNTTINLPKDPISMKVKFQGPSYWNTTLSNVPPGFGEIHNGSYLGWCVEKDTHIQQDKLYNATLFSSYDPNLGTLCPRCAKENWTLVNYLLNHKQGNKDQIQDAIWYLLLDGTLPSSSVSRAMIHDAQANGTGFQPLPGQNFSIIVFVPNNSTNGSVQLTFIEVDP